VSASLSFNYRPIHYHSHPQQTTLDKELSNYRPILKPIRNIQKKQYEQRASKSRLTEHVHK